VAPELAAPAAQPAADRNIAAEEPYEDSIVLVKTPEDARIPILLRFWDITQLMDSSWAPGTAAPVYEAAFNDTENSTVPADALPISPNGAFLVNFAEQHASALGNLPSQIPFARPIATGLKRCRWPEIEIRLQYRCPPCETSSAGRNEGRGRP
jgi:hypothetical protein